MTEDQKHPDQIRACDETRPSRPGECGAHLLQRLPGNEPRYFTSIRSIYNNRNAVKVEVFIPSAGITLEASFGVGPEISAGAAVEVGKVLRRLLADQIGELGLKDVAEIPATPPVELVTPERLREIADAPPQVSEPPSDATSSPPAQKRRGRPPGKAKEAPPEPPPAAEAPASVEQAPPPEPEPVKEPEPQVPIPATAQDLDVMTLDKALNFVIVYGTKSGKKMSEVGDNMLRWYATVMLLKIRNDDKRVPTAGEERQALAAKTILEERARK